MTQIDADLTTVGIPLLSLWNRGNCETSRAFSPSAFQLGEKVPKADEGAVLALKLSVFMSFPRPFMKPVHRLASSNGPSSAFGTFSPPLKNAVGRRTLDEHCACDSNQMVRNPGYPPTSAPSADGFFGAKTTSHGIYTRCIATPTRGPYPLAP
ncbi:MAG TPA: hypothetical protein VLC46_18180 [Thermoanaerobaculia bacterium]|jgi:hypothetical protein|nr:hypothetical protein [Thermoanaerobaculia bacterium]